MPYNIGDWNAQDRLDTDEASDALVAWLQTDNLDAAVITQAVKDNGNTQKLDALKDRLRGIGYHMHIAAYQDTDDRPDKHGLAMVVRLDKLVDGIDGIQELHLGAHPDQRKKNLGRVALHAVLGDPVTDPATHINLFGIHLDDRLEANRLSQQASLLQVIHGLNHERVVIAGDMNAMHPQGLKAAAFRASGFAVSRFAPAEPGREPQKIMSRQGIEWVGRRIVSLLQRLGQMASSAVMPQFEHEHFRDLDEQHRNTMYFGPFMLRRLHLGFLSLGQIGIDAIPVAQLEHILVGEGLEGTVQVQEPLVSGSKRLNGSHRRLVATVGDKTPAPAKS